MNVLLIIVCILVGIILLILIAALFAPTNWSIEADILINKPKQDIFNYIKILRHSENYNKWVMTDPNMKKDFRGTDGTVGFVYCWDSENKSVGKGEQEITKLKDGEIVDYEIRFIKPFQGTSTANISLESVSQNQTKVIWVFGSSNNYMMKVLHVVLNLKKVLTKDLQTSLNNLKTILEK